MQPYKNACSLHKKTKHAYEDANRLLLPVQWKVLQHSAAPRENKQRVEQVGHAEYAAGHERDSPLEAHGRCLDQEEDIPAQEDNAANGEHENDRREKAEWTLKAETGVGGG